MNILYFTDEFPPFFRGGLGTYSMEMSRRFARMGHSMIVFSRCIGDSPTRDLWEGIEVHRPMLVDMTDVLPVMIPEDVRRWPIEAQNFFAETLGYNILSSTKAVNLLVKKDRRKFDIIVSHDWLAAIAGIMSKKALGLPFVLHLHSVEEGRTQDGSPTIKNLEKFGAKIADIIITVSYAMRDSLISLGYPEKKIRVVHNGVNQNKYDPSRFPEISSKEFREAIGVGNSPMILFIGRLSWVKGVDTLVRAMPFILREVPNAKLVILGKGDQEGLLRDMVSHMGLKDNVILHYKVVDERERLRYYAACDIAVFPSKYEPFGIVCTEAMSMAKPVIVGATGVNGLREQIVSAGPGRCGAHINPYDPGDIAKFVVEFLKDENLRKTLGANARNRVIERFSLDAVAKQTIEIYQDLVEEHSGQKVTS